MGGLRLGLGVFALAVVAGPVDAGPIWFTYRVDGYTTQSAAGPLSFQQASTGSVPFDPATQSSVLLATVRPDLQTPEQFSVSNNTPATDPTNKIEISRFAMKVQITDSATSQQSVVRLTGWETITWNASNPNGVTQIGFDPFSSDIVLGNQTFRLAATGSLIDTGDTPTGTVSLDAVTSAQAPEPATLALAGIGLVGWAAIRRRNG
jgi:hypothetical protein